MAQSLTEICNLALGLLHERNITSIEETGSQTALHCRTYAQQAIDELVTVVEPTEALAEATLAQISFTGSDYQKAYRYALPETPFCLKILAANGKPWVRTKNEVIGRQIASDDSTMFMRYIGRISNVGTMGPLLVNTCAYAIAIKLAVVLKQSDTDRQRLYDEYNGMVLPELIGQYRAFDPSQSHLTGESEWLLAAGGGYW